MDPATPKAGGIQSGILDFIKFSPSDFDINLIGLTVDKSIRLGQWMKLKAGGRSFNFLPVMFEKNPDRRKLIPLAFRFSVSLAFLRMDFSGQVLFFHRFEPALALAHLNIPRVLVVHNDIEEQILGKNSEVLWSRFPFFYFLLEKYIIKKLLHIYSVTQNTTEFYKTRYPQMKEKFSFLPEWVDSVKFCSSSEPKAALKQKLASFSGGLEPKKKWILFAGRLQSQKAPFRLLDVFSEYHKKDLSSCLVIAGDGNARLDMERYVGKLGLGGAVIFLGTIGHGSLIDFYRASDVLLLVSFFEGMPRCILEALSCGLPVVATNVGEIKLIVKNGFSGELSEDASVSSLALCLDKVLSRASEYGKENCIASIRDYTPQTVLAGVYGLLRSL